MSYHHEGKRRKDGSQRRYPRLGVGNTDLGLLKRFHVAVGCGRIDGPYARYDQKDKTREVKPIYNWGATHAQARIAARLLLPFLSEVKGRRVEEAFSGTDV